MISTKNLSLRECNKCNIQLTSENWNNYDKRASRYICKTCRKSIDRKYYLDTPDYRKKQVARYRERKSAIIHSYGDACVQCGEDNYYKLTIDYKFEEENVNRKILTRSSMYEWLYNNPVHYDGYQILCYNCNCSKRIIYKDKYALRDKKKVMEAYGNQCAECKENKIERLTIDHKNNDGYHQRKELQYFRGARMYRWLIKNNYPNNLGLQILCFNCNAAKYQKQI